MPLCGGKDDHHNQPVQKVLIPKGMINPRETTIIEIPARLHKQPLVIAKKKANGPANNYTSEPYSKKTNWSKFENSGQQDDFLNYSQMPPPMLSSTANDSSYFPQEQNTSYQYWDNSHRQDQTVIPPPTHVSMQHSSPPRQLGGQRSQRPYTPVSVPPMKPDLDLDSTEREEKVALQRNLEEFQRARRKLLTSASYLVNHSHLENSSPNQTY